MSLPPLLQIFWDPLRGRGGGDLQNNQYFSKARKTFPPPPFSHSRGKKRKNPMASKKREGVAVGRKLFSPFSSSLSFGIQLEPTCLREYPPYTELRKKSPPLLLPFLYSENLQSPSAEAPGFIRGTFMRPHVQYTVRAYLGMGKTLVASIPLLLVSLFLLRSPMCYRRAWFYIFLRYPPTRLPP